MDAGRASVLDRSREAQAGDRICLASENLPRKRLTTAWSADDQVLSAQEDVQTLAPGTIQQGQDLHDGPP